jgi:hypothetical protein
MAKKRKRRKRRPPAADVAAADRQPDVARKRGRVDEPPPPPWGSFPLSELVVLLALILLVAGFFIQPPRGPIMIGTGLVLGSLAGLELSAREHFAGYRSHTMVLAGSAGMTVFLGLVLTNAIGPLPSLIAGAVVGGAAAWFFAGAFRRRSGGALFKAGIGPGRRGR